MDFDYRENFKPLKLVTLPISADRKFSIEIRSDGDLTTVQHTFKNVNNCLITNIYSYLETSGGQSSNQY
jgi:hypothetical protein